MTAQIRNHKVKNTELKKDYHYNDVAIIRYNQETSDDCINDQAVHVVGVRGLWNLFDNRAQSEEWLKVKSIQTNIKTKMGCGHPIIVNFYATADEQDAIIYDYKALGEDEFLIKSDNEKYCLK